MEIEVADRGQVTAVERDRSILLTNYHLRALAGSELVTLDLGRLFRDWGWDVTVAAWDVGQPMQRLFIDNGMTVVSLDDSSLQRDFDLLWAHHWPTISTVLGSGRTGARKVVFSSLGPSEPLETPPLGGGIDLYAAVSQETARALRSLSIPPESIAILPNSLTADWFEGPAAPPKTHELKSVVIVSNHAPEEVRAATAMLVHRGITVEYVGGETSPVLVTPDVVRGHDAVVSIGRTVIQAFAVGVPVFCYDIFGGPGWIRPESVEQAAEYNFSGRDALERLSATQLADCLEAGFSHARDGTDALRSWARSNCSLETNIRGILERVDANVGQGKATPGDSWHSMARYAQCVYRLNEQAELRQRQISAMQSTRGWRLLERLRYARAVASHVVGRGSH